ncbi:hypothetical protein CAEBREN_00656 [Caenorhabditis brenneri]|uniref:Uncharacterized protein n=1 Tax=Caenorhabditis brenneri TaxID=135651 RepID=G0PA37_CAEBE|nr:hypothetical protein CAEBREN_00656 [Caenorhabditis brenneri]
MASQHHSEGRKNREKRGDVKKIRGQTKKRNHRNPHETSQTNSKPKHKKHGNFSRKNQYGNEKSSRIYRNDRSARPVTKNTSSSSSPARSPWATPPMPRNRSPWSRSPERPDGFYSKSSEIPCESESKGNSGNQNSNSCCTHYEEEYESTYVYEKIEGWDTDTDNEETTKSQ